MCTIRNNITEIASLHMRKDNGDFTQEEVTNITNNFLTKVMKSEKEKNMNDDVIFCPLMSQVAPVAWKMANTITGAGMKGTCFRENCGFWNRCPANKDSLLTAFVQDVCVADKYSDDIDDTPELDAGIR